jgi:hypothetical protein
MCRNIKTLFNFEPAASKEEIRGASLQFVRKISGFTKPSRPNEAAFCAAIEEIAAAADKLLASLETNAPAKDRATEAAKARARAPRGSGARRSSDNLQITCRQRRNSSKSIERRSASSVIPVHTASRLPAIEAR